MIIKWRSVDFIALPFVPVALYYYYEIASSCDMTGLSLEQAELIAQRVNTSQFLDLTIILGAMALFIAFLGFLFTGSGIDKAPDGTRAALDSHNPVPTLAILGLCLGILPIQFRAFDNINVARELNLCNVTADSPVSAVSTAPSAGSTETESVYPEIRMALDKKCLFGLRNVTINDWISFHKSVSAVLKMMSAMPSQCRQ